VSRWLHVVDSHTEGEPTRVAVAGWPQPSLATMAERRDEMRLRHDRLRTGMLLEPRGYDALVGAVLTPPVSAGAIAGVVFCNDAGYLDMCVHGTIGVVRTLEFLGRVEPGVVRLDTPAGTVAAELHGDGAVTVANIACRCTALDVELDVPGVGRVTGDIAYGGNWFFLTELAGMSLERDNVAALLRATSAIRAALASAGITGDAGAPLEHIEVFGPPHRPDADARNFVLCPGAAYDRSPCGTGTSAKMAALHKRGLLPVDGRWIQESIVGSTFAGRLREAAGDEIWPEICGRAYITAKATLRFDSDDPYRYGL
jgi:4-hydroxyproline epimerase